MSPCSRTHACSARLHAPLPSCPPPSRMHQRFILIVRFGGDRNSCGYAGGPQSFRGITGSWKGQRPNGQHSRAGRVRGRGRRDAEVRGREHQPAGALPPAGGVGHKCRDGRGGRGDVLGIRQQQERIPAEDAQHVRRHPQPQDPQVQEGELLSGRHPRALPEDGQGAHSRRRGDVRDRHEHEEGPEDSREDGHRQARMSRSCWHVPWEGWTCPTSGSMPPT